MSAFITKTIGEICDMTGGIVKTGPFGSQLHQSDYQETGIPVVMPANINDNSINCDCIARVSECHVRRLSTHKLDVGDIVYGRRGDIGRQALVTNESAGWLCGTGCLKIRVGHTAVDPKYLHYYLRMNHVVDWIYNQAIGATMPNLNTSILRRVPIVFPESLKVQKKIIAILSAYDDLIENNNRRIAILEKMAEELYKEWFVRMRFPGHEKVKLEKGIPEGWTYAPVGKLVDYQIGGGWGIEHPNSSYVPVYVLRGTDFNKILSGSFDSLPLRYETTSVVSSRSLKHGDIVIENSVNAQSRSAGNTILITKEILKQFNCPVIPASFCKLVRLKDSKYAFIIWRNLKVSYEQGLMAYYQNIATNGIANFQMKRFINNYLVKIPKEGFDDIFCSLFWSFDTSKYLSMNNMLRYIRDRLLSRLISGNISVDALDIKFPKSIEEEFNNYG